MRTFVTLCVVTLFLVDVICAQRYKGRGGGRGFHTIQHDYTAIGEGDGEADGSGIVFGEAISGGKGETGKGNKPRAPSYDEEDEESEDDDDEEPKDEDDEDDEEPKDEDDKDEFGAEAEGQGEAEGEGIAVGEAASDNRGLKATGIRVNKGFFKGGGRGMIGGGRGLRMKPWWQDEEDEDEAEDQGFGNEGTKGLAMKNAIPEYVRSKGRRSITRPRWRSFGEGKGEAEGEGIAIGEAIYRKGGSQGRGIKVDSGYARGYGSAGVSR